jgi:neutral ceramidase
MRIPTILNLGFPCALFQSSIVNRQSSILIVFLFLAPALILSPAAAQDAGKPWRAGLASVDITPAESIWLAGYGARTKPSEGVIAPIFAKALVLEDPRGSRLVIITSDILGFTRALSDPIADQLARKLKLRRDQILFTSSHTHSAPVVRDYAVFSYGLTQEQEAAVERYSRELETKVAQVVEQAFKDRSPARLSFGRGKAGFAINRRVSKPDGFQISVNPVGPVDHEVPVMRIAGTDGELRGILFGYACHNTTLGGDIYQVNGDYAGFAQAALEKKNPGATALFVSGFAGDANPNPRGKLEHAQQYGEDLANSVNAVLSQKMEPVSGNLATAFDYVQLPFSTPPTKEELEARLKEKDLIRQRNARRMLDIIAREGRLPSHYPYPIQVAQFGTSSTLIALGGEVVVDYSIRLRKELAEHPLFLIAYANDVMGYIPSLRVLKEGGYEGGGSMMFYLRPGTWAEGVEEMIVEKVRQLVRRVRN